MVTRVSVFGSGRPRAQHQPRRWSLVMGVAVMVLAIVYAGLTNDVATQGYRLHDLQRTIAARQAQQSSLQIEIAAAQSLQRIESEAPALALTPVKNVEYVTSSTTAVAVR